MPKASTMPRNATSFSILCVASRSELPSYRFRCSANCSTCWCARPDGLEPTRGMPSSVGRDSFPAVGTTPEVMVVAADLATHHRFAIWDAVILSAASHAGCRLLLSEDLQAGFTWGGVTVVDPSRFAAPCVAGVPEGREWRMTRADSEGRPRPRRAVSPPIRSPAGPPRPPRPRRCAWGRRHPPESLRRSCGRSCRSGPGWWP